MSAQCASVPYSRFKWGKNCPLAIVIESVSPHKDDGYSGNGGGGGGDDGDVGGDGGDDDGDGGGNDVEELRLASNNQRCTESWYQPGRARCNQLTIVIIQSLLRALFDSKILATTLQQKDSEEKHCQRHNGPRVLTPYLE